MFTNPINSILKRTTIALPALAALILPSCVPAGNPSKPNPNATKPLKAVHVNPHTAGSYAHFKAQKSYPKTYKVYKNHSLLAKTNSGNSRVVIDLSLQRAFLMNNGVVAMDYPVSTGTSKHPTPTGSFSVVEKLAADKRSSLYGKILDANGKTVKSGADSRKHKVPAGGKFQGALMAHWMRLTWDGIGMHRGRVPRYPASHGCIRTPGSVVPTVFRKVRIGTKVTIQR